MLQTLQTRFYTDWDFYRRVLVITLPIAIQNVINLGVNMMDIIMLGQLGDTAIAAANLGGQLFIILNVTGFGLASGAAVLIAQYWGKRDMLRILGARWPMARVKILPVFLRVIRGRRSFRLLI